MELTRILAKYKTAATIVLGESEDWERDSTPADQDLAAVAGEEQDLYGSNFLAQSYENASVNIQGMFTNDIVGSSTADDGTKDPYTLRIFALGTPTTESAAMASLRAEIGGENDSPARNLARFVVEVAENNYT